MYNMRPIFSLMWRALCPYLLYNAHLLFSQGYFGEKKVRIRREF